MQTPNLNEEKKLWKKGYKMVACLDEAGRGSLAGPVVAAAVAIIENCKLKIKNLKDSKKLSAKQREEIYKSIIKNPKIEWGIGKVSERVIDKINILEATKLAMNKALKNLERKLKQKYHNFYDRKKNKIFDFLILDGKMKLNLPIPQKSIVKADEKVFSCALSSILAKVTRDKIMEGYHKQYPQYNFLKNKGYPTKYHLKAIEKYGHCKIHRQTFKGAIFEKK
jgi:ribonuclease HII